MMNLSTCEELHARQFIGLPRGLYWCGVRFVGPDADDRGVRHYVCDPPHQFPVRDTDGHSMNIVSAASDAIEVMIDAYREHGCHVRGDLKGCDLHNRSLRELQRNLQDLLPIMRAVGFPAEGGGR